MYNKYIFLSGTNVGILFCLLISFYIFMILLSEYSA